MRPTDDRRHDHLAGPVLARAVGVGAVGDEVRTMTGKASRDRGARCERAIVAWLRSNGYPDARRVLAGDGRQHSDVEFHPLISLEAKDVASSAWPSWQRQAEAQARPGTVPVVVRRTRGNPAVGEWLCRVPMDACLGPDRLLPPPVALMVVPGGWIETTFAMLVDAIKRGDE